VYYRFNPVVQEPYINEYRPEKLQQYKEDAWGFIRANEQRFDTVAAVLTQKRAISEQVRDFVRRRPLGRKLAHRLLERAQNIGLVSSREEHL